MTDHRNPEYQVPEGDRPTRAQLRYLRALASQTGQTFTTPRTKTQASDQIKRLQHVARTGGGDAAPRGTYHQGDCTANATAYRHDEITGYGATARWA